MCKETSDTIKMAEDVTNVMKRLMIAKRPPTPGEMDELDAIVKKISNHKSSVKTMKCALNKCGEQWEKWTNSKLEKSSKQLIEIMRILRTKSKLS